MILFPHKLKRVWRAIFVGHHNNLIDTLMSIEMRGQFLDMNFHSSNKRVIEV